jgi:hypothetical protein
MNWNWFLTQMLARLTEVVPWLLGALTAVGVFSFSPLGRELIHRLRSRRGEADLAEAMLQDLSEVRQLLGETVERLDATERRLAQLYLSPPAAPLLQAPPPGRDETVRTPH